MEIFVPHQKDKNIYFDEIISFSRNNFVFGSYKEYKNSFKIVNIQFPEAIFDWIAPSSDQLLDLELKFQKWKRYSQIVYTMNDAVKHYDENNQYLALFKLVHKYADGVVHLGEYSLRNYKKYFQTTCLHTVIYHPLYTSLLYEFKSKDIQEIVTIELQNRFVVSVIGGIRSKEELRFILKAFRKIPIKSKVLIIPRMFQLVKIPDYVPYRYRKVYRRIIENLYFFPLSKNQYFFESRFLDYPYVIDLVKRSSLMIIPRLKNLNSGNLFLGLTFDKQMLIPEIGNMTEVANMFNLPLLDLQKKNFDEVIESIIKSDKIQFDNATEYVAKKKLFHPKKISKEYDAFFNLLNSRQ